MIWFFLGISGCKWKGVWSRYTNFWLVYVIFHLRMPEKFYYCICKNKWSLRVLTKPHVLVTCQSVNPLSLSHLTHLFHYHIVLLNNFINVVFFLLINCFGDLYFDVNIWTCAGVPMKRIPGQNPTSFHIRSWKIWDWNSLQWVSVYMKQLRVCRRKATFLFLQSRKIQLQSNHEHKLNSGQEAAGFCNLGYLMLWY